MQFQGTAWTDDDMTARCAQESGTFRSEGCVDEAAGWCDKMIADEKHESTVMVLSAMADCNGSKMACETFMSGTFMAAGECLTASTSTPGTGESSLFGAPSGVTTGGNADAGSWQSAGTTSTDNDSSAMKCLLAPGAIGAAHQAGFSKGYSSSCPNTPAQQSPYMWPLKWSADTENQAMAYGSDDVVFTSRGKTFYMLDRNWKRSDTSFQEGLLRTIGQGPCADVDEETAEEGFLGCRKNQTDGSMSTMIHREGLMYFISWKEDGDNPVQPGEVDATKIEECTMINLAVIGNIRPDWFLDKRGDDTDVQYLGDQHVYYADGAVPKLVKQWRKKDFASQYFVMSMMGNPPNKLENATDAPVEDNIHWPMILNIPGEGFGDDSLQVYRNHKLLTDEDEELFKLIENYQAIGGECVDIRAMGEGDGNVGPPVLDEEEKIRSNLEVDPLSWASNEITFSPIWEVPVKETVATLDFDESTMAASASSNSKSVLQVSDRITVESCYDESTSSMDMSIHFHDIEPTFDGKLPWMAIGYRPTELCAMTPPDGGVTPIVLVTHSEEDGSMPEAHKTMLLPEAKAYSQDAFSSIMTSRKPLGDVEDYMDVVVEAPMVVSNTAIQVARSSSTSSSEDTVSLHFKQVVEGNTKPEVLNLMYAIGMTSQLGSHTTRGCFQLQDITPCSDGGGDAGGSQEGSSTEDNVDTIAIDLGGLRGKDEATAAAKSSANMILSAGVMMFATISTVAAFMVGL